MAQLRPALTKEGWTNTSEISRQYGPAPSPRPYEDITMPRGAQPRGTLPTRGDQESIPEVPRYAATGTASLPHPPLGNHEDERRTTERGSQEELELQDITGHYADLDLEEPGPAPPTHAPEPSSQPEPTYAVVNKKKKTLQLEGQAEGVGDSWV